MMDMNIETTNWSSLTYEEKNRRLFLREKELLDMFLKKGAITEAQHDKSLHDLIEKMGMEDTVKNINDGFINGN